MRSLVISPNLDALLEHEDRTRAQTLSSQSVPPNEDLFVGLPPPPRHPRVKMPRPTRANPLPEPHISAKPPPTSILVQPKSSSISNPYINPAPTLAELDDIRLVATAQARPYQLSELSSHQSDSLDRSQSPIIFTSPWSAVGEYSSQQSCSSTLRASNPLSPYDSCVDGSPEDRQCHSDSASKPWRPLNSYTKRSSTFPGYLEPANTLANPESRISISRTVYSLSQSELNLNNTLTCPSLPPIQSCRLGSWSSISSSGSSKQNPLKPVFDDTSLKPGSRQLPPIPTAPLPPTTNFLDSGERADLVRKTRKLARVFGKTPRADTIPAQETSSFRMSSVLNELDWPIRRRPSTPQSNLGPGAVRRHSVPVVSQLTQSSPSPIEQAGRHAHVKSRSAFDEGDTASVMPEPDNINEDRRRKQERLSKLHRFLGSRVPINLVLGTDDDVEGPSSPLPKSESSPTTWLRQKSSSAILGSSNRSNDLERVKADLDEKEKHINVRRAVKMEKVFGVAPPQTLYHTRLCPPPLPPSEGSSTARPVDRNFTQSIYLKRKDSRPGSDSNVHLVPKAIQTSDDVSDAWATGHSLIYNSYQHSLNSLHDILAWDDRESLVELHQYLHTEKDRSSPFEVSPAATGRRISNASSLGRRRSLPVLTSRPSFDSESIPTSPNTGFQVRRRRAAKLTQFFGVDYRELINDVLQSIENGVENEHESGTLGAEEAEDLLARLSKLKDKRRRSESFLCLD